MSSKNQPQLAYMSSVARCSSSSSRAAIARRLAARRQRRPRERAPAAGRAPASGSSTTVAVGVARAPRIDQQLAGRVLVEGRRRVAHRGRAPRAAARARPGSSPASAAHVAAAVAPPAAERRARSSRPSPRRRARRRAAPPRSGGCCAEVGAEVGRPRCPRAPPRRGVAKASVRSANFLWWPHSSPSEAHSTSRWPGRPASARPRRARRRAGSRRGSAASPKATARDSGPSNTAERDRCAPSRRGAASGRRARCRGCRGRPPSSRSPGGAHRRDLLGRQDGVASRRARSASPASPGRDAGLGQPQPLGGAAEAALESRAAPRASCVRRSARRRSSGTIGCA